MRYGDFGPAEYKRQEMAERNRTLASQVALLRITSPISGVVVTPRVDDLLGAYLESGAEIAEVADPSTMTARIYIPEFAMREVRLGSKVRLQTESRPCLSLQLFGQVPPASTAMEPGLDTEGPTKGRNPATFLHRVGMA